jgi:hypothetical protein
MEMNGWEKYQELVLYKLKENTDAVKDIAKTMNDMKNDISALKVKATIAGGIAGIVATGISTMILTAMK